MGRSRKIKYFIKKSAYLYIIYFICNLQVCAQTFITNLNSIFNVTQKIFRSQDNIKLKVPKSFEGRTAKQNRQILGIELKNVIRYEYSISDYELRGRATIFDFESTSNKFTIQAFKSKQLKPGYNQCMSCHDSKIPKTSLLISHLSQSIDPQPIIRNNMRITIDEADIKAHSAILNHWISENTFVSTSCKFGKIEQANLKLDANSLELQAVYFPHRKFFISNTAIFTKVKNLTSRKTFECLATYMASKRLRLSLGGGIFFDGYTQFGTEMSEMGAIITKLARDDPQLLPNLYHRLKNEKFGYIKSTFYFELNF